MKIQQLLNELTAEYDAKNQTPEWGTIIMQICDLTPYSQGYVRYCVAKYVDRYY